jgi:ribosomal protein L9
MKKMYHLAELKRLQNALQQSAHVQTELDRRVFYLKTLYDVSKDIFGSVESEKILRRFLLMAMGNFGVSKGFILTLDSPSQAIQHFVAVGLEQEDETHLKTGIQQLTEQGLLSGFAANEIDPGRQNLCRRR